MPSHETGGCRSVKQKYRINLGLVLLAGFWLGGCESTPATDEAAWVPSDPMVVEAKADRILREMGDFLRAADRFTFSTKVTTDIVEDSGHKIEYGGGADIAVHKPNRIRADYNGDLRSTLSIYDGSTITIHDRMDDVYAVTEAPPTIDEALDFLVDTYGFTIPLADLLYEDPYAVLSEYAHTGFWAGLHSIEGTPCHHLTFVQDAIDWQIWIEDGSTPVPRRVVITYKSELGSPQYSATLSNWDFSPRIDDNAFQFSPPESAGEIEFLPTAEEVTFDDMEEER